MAHLVISYLTYVPLTVLIVLFTIQVHEFNFVHLWAYVESTYMIESLQRSGILRCIFPACRLDVTTAIRVFQIKI